MADNTITIIGNLTSDPELRFTPSGVAVANLSIAQTPRTFDKATNEWKDGETNFFRSAIWRSEAENVAASLHKGDRVIITGTLKVGSYEKDGIKHTTVEIEQAEVAASFKYATAVVTRVRGGGSGNGQSGQGGQASQPASAPAAQPASVPASGDADF